MTRVPHTDLDVFELNLGGNVFGWTADRANSFAVLDAYTEAGGNFIDTADSYTQFVDGNQGGESETLIGQWLAERGNRDQIVLATKVGALNGRRGLGKDTVIAAAEDSLRRLGTDHIDLYYAHFDDQDTPQEETLAAFDQLVRAGKVRYLGASNFSAERLRAALRISEREGLARYVALQPHYNLLERDYETELAGVAAEHELGVFPYFGLAAGFLTGKLRREGPSDDPRRAEISGRYADARGQAVLDALERVATVREVAPATVALAWLRAQPTVTAPIASARHTGQLPTLLASTHLELTADELAALDVAARTNPGIE